MIPVFDSILGCRTPPPACTDGLVPYASAHLDGAASELVVRSGHSVQETPEAIRELRRILRLDGSPFPTRAPSFM